MNALLAALALILGVVVALFVPGGAPAVLLCALLAAAAAALVARVKDQRTFLLQVFFGGLLVRALIATLIYGFELQDFFGGDAYTYDSVGHALLDM